MVFSTFSSSLIDVIYGFYDIAYIIAYNIIDYNL